MPHSTSPGQDADPTQVLVSVADLLHRTASAAWARANLEGPFGATYSVAHAIYLAATLTANLVPKGAEVPSTDFDVSPGDTAAALTGAEQLLHAVPVESLPAGSFRLVTILGDLTRQVHP